MKRIYLAGGCFWGVQGYFKTIKGTKFSTVGYANSNIEAPTYKQVCQGNTNAVETLELYYDEENISLSQIIEKLFEVIDPTALNYQGPDHGTQYRNGIYFETQEDKEIIENTIEKLSKNINGKVVTEVKKLDNYYLAEEYHQDYSDKNPSVVCHIKF
ncbi:peptide-methionine (S)-S-oxide reductase MsrA [Mycoplasma sp. CSL7503-lung]|uniref:peptide-methionine (S)-S-oxide reductase MsrA n=1 Tax=Mycoplasma sp. CSL7503-lung TaxID=536372 RepID=UPI0021D3DE07|nr:peptide-methionine (S)-S-oxide reductase MsrA [Mycoplasma sp. CSL7503-lung]MCU4706602.1 peptide-methionine (S)-S-oxide reductase MsrA [Mycoplasma sp. CSL7503-lung]